MSHGLIRIASHGMKLVATSPITMAAGRRADVVTIAMLSVVRAMTQPIDRIGVPTVPIAKAVATMTASRSGRYRLGRIGAGFGGRGRIGGSLDQRTGGGGESSSMRVPGIGGGGVRACGNGALVTGSPWVVAAEMMTAMLVRVRTATSR